MPVRFFYVDESFDSNKFCLSAISIRDRDWKDCFEQVKQHRRNLKNDFGIYVRKEIHARELVSGRGKLGPNTIAKWERSRIYNGILNLIASLPNVWVFNVCLDVQAGGDTQMKAWDRLINRIERTMLEHERIEIPLRRELSAKASEQMAHSDADKISQRLNDFQTRAVIFADEGREREITSAMRKMHIINYIPSKFGDWGLGNYTKNIQTAHLIEDPIFKKSERSYFIQLADCVAFGLLKREVAATPNVARYGIDKMFEDALSGVCYRKCSPNDPLGIVRK